jgi:PAB-dependent poly(A)-specific ribonuclease subunit 3
MAVRAFEEMDGVHASMDQMHDSLMGVYESGKALRLLLKLAFVNERPEFGIDQRWSELGDCYILKLFRDLGEFLIHYGAMNNWFR